MRNSFDDFVDKNASAIEIAEVDFLLERAASLVDDVFEKNEMQMKEGLEPEVISSEKISELREVLDRIPNLVINFDDTITRPPLTEDSTAKENQTILHILSQIKDRYPEKQDVVSSFGSQKHKVAYFYEKILAGLSRDEVSEIYKNVIMENDVHEEVLLNENFVDVCKSMKEHSGLNTIPLFVLFLNNPELIRMFYEKYAHVFTELKEEHDIDVKVCGVMGNQIHYDTDGKVKGIIQHVTNENKEDYIPDSSIMLADDREVNTLNEAGVNVINIQVGSYDPEMLELSYQVRELKIENRDEGIHEFSFVLRAMQKLTIIKEAQEIDIKKDKGKPLTEEEAESSLDVDQLKEDLRIFLTTLRR